MIKKIREKVGLDYAREILDSQKNIIIIIKNNKIVDANKAFFNFFGFKNIEELKRSKKSLSLFFEREKGFLSGESWFEQILNNPSIYYKIKIIRHNKEFVFKAEASEFKDKIIITLTDITKLFEQKQELKEVNELLEQYKKAVDKLLIVSKTDTKGIITYVNKNFCDISGYKEDELIGKPHNIVRHPDMPKDIFKDMWRTIKRGNIWRGVIKNLKKDGSAYWVDAGIMPIKNHKGEIVEYIALRTDITEVVKAKEKAQAAEKAKSIFLANMSHEIRTPLNAILGFTQLLEKHQNLDNNVKKYVEIINSSANTLLKVINDILDISKIETGNISIDKKEFNPKKVFWDIFSLFLARVKEKNIKYKIDIDDLPVCIISDEHRLKQVLANLIGNAIKFTSENGEISVSVKILEEDEQKVKLKFSVKDSGIGISKDKQKDIFKAFNQADGSITRKFGGTGLGLTISSRIVQKLGGNIKVESEEGKGSEFYFTLEFEKCDKKEETKLAQEQNFSHKVEILVAEDDEFNQEFIKAILEEWNIKYTIVSNGKEAVKNVKKHKYDFIFLDINMPEMNGVEAVREIKKLTSAPVIAMTANAFKDDVDRYFKAGFDGYISKPIKLEELQKIFEEYVQKNKTDSQENYLSFLQDSLKLNKDIVLNLVNVYFKNVEEDLANLKMSVEKKDFEEIIKYTHKIKGSSLNLRLNKIAKAAADMEDNAKVKNTGFDYKVVLNNMNNYINKIKQEVESENNSV